MASDVARQVVAWIIGNLLWDFIRMTSLSVFLWAALRYAFRVFGSWWQDLAFWLTVPIGLALAVVFIGGSRLPSKGPDLTGSIDRVRLFRTNETEPSLRLGESDMGVLVVANITNGYDRAPSVADDYRLIIQPRDPGIRPIEGERVVLPEALVLHRPHGQIEVYSGGDALYNKTMAPIPGGALMRGVLVFRLKDVDAKELRKSGTKYSLLFVDIAKHPHELPYDWPTTEDENSGYIPGLKIMGEQECPAPQTPIPNSSGTVQSR